MQLSEAEVQEALGQAQSAFPAFTRWQCTNEIDELGFGFSLWGEFASGPPEDRRRFFITLDTYHEAWRGHLTVGQYAYMWTSADFGDAYLVNTERCRSLTDAIAELKVQIVTLFRAFSAT